MDTNNSTLITEELGIGQLPKNVQDEIVSKLGESALKNAMLEIISKLSEENLKEFETISKSEDIVKIRDFLQKNIPNFDTIVNEETKKIIADFKKIKAETV